MLIFKYFMVFTFIIMVRSGKPSALRAENYPFFSYGRLPKTTVFRKRAPNRAGPKKQAFSDR